MPTYDGDLLDVARRLIARHPNQRGKLPAARIRRSVSTCYYALFHFLLHEAGRVLIGSTNDLQRRRRTLARAFSHSGMKTALDKVRGAWVDRSVADLLRPPGIAGGPVAAPDFARELATVFSDAQAKRHDADYDLNVPLSELDARSGRQVHGRLALCQYCARQGLQVRVVHVDAAQGAAQMRLIWPMGTGAPEGLRARAERSEALPQKPQAFLCPGSIVGSPCATPRDVMSARRSARRTVDTGTWRRPPR